MDKDCMSIVMSYLTPPPYIDQVQKRCPTRYMHMPGTQGLLDYLTWRRHGAWKQYVWWPTLWHSSQGEPMIQPFVFAEQEPTLRHPLFQQFRRTPAYKLT
jgi:hypothetical protein